MPDRSRQLRIHGLAGSLVLFLLCAHDAAAFGPDAAVTIGVRALRVLPPEVLDPACDGMLAGAVTQRIEGEQADPEHHVPSHRFDGLAAADPAATGDPSGAGPADAPHAFARAADSLRVAFASGDPANCSAGIASLALAACDLADPFQMTSPGLDEVPGARAGFSDGATAATLEWVATAGASESPRAEPAMSYRALDAALALARVSAGLRDSVERLTRSGDAGALEALQRERLSAAAGLARAATSAAWEAATSARSVPGVLRVRPNPVRDFATLSFVVPVSGPVRLEWFDVAGRRVTNLDLGVLPAGPHMVSFDRRRAGSLAPGVYLARLVLPGRTATGRIVLSGE